MHTGRKQIHGIVQGALFAALLCILSPIAIPVGPVPVTLSIFVVLLASLVLEWKPAVSAVLVYILIGLIGLPVFSGGGSGFGVLVGPTGGYLWAYLPMAALVSKFGRREGWVIPVLYSVASLMLCYLLGTWQFTMVMNCGWKEAVSLCVLPFIAFDMIKVGLAVLLGTQIRRRLQKAELL